MLNIMKVLKKYRKRIAALLMIPLLILSSLLIPSQKAKASTQISAWTDFKRTYQGNSYDFHVYGTQAQGLPNDYSFNSEVIDFVISKSGDAYDHTIYDSGIYVADWIINTGMDKVQGVLSLFANAYIALNSFAQDYIFRDWTGVYLWEFEFTGSDENYVGSADFGTAYGFTFHGLCGDKIDLVLDSSGDFYGQNRLGNWTYGVQTPEYIPHIIHQADPDNVWIPSVSAGNFNDLKPPYIYGKSLHFFYYIDTSEHEVIINDFTDTSILIQFDMYGNGKSMLYFFFIPVSNHTISGTDNGNVINFSIRNQPTSIDNENLTISGNYSQYYFTIGPDLPPKSFVLPCWNSIISPQGNYNILGYYQNTAQLGHSNIYLNSIPYTPVTPNTDPIPVDVPIPVTEIPSDPDDPLPQDPNPDPVPGITYPVNPSIPLPPFATIVSGNDDLWGITLDFEGAQDGLLPYMNSLYEFQFPSFSDLISDFSGSIIWVAQLMSILYNGTPLNVLFIALCLFSLVSVLIGAYKLWNSTEPDPGNPGMRRYKRPPKGGKKH